MNNPSSTKDYLKFISLCLNAILLAFLAWLLFKKPNNVHAPLPQDTVKTIPKVDDTSPDLQVCMDCNEETEGQTFEHFSNVVNNYRTKIWDLRNAHSDFSSQNTVGKNFYSLNAGNYYKTADARTIWFPLATIKRFICTIESYNKKLASPKQNLGIRFYYAIYENNYAITEKQNHHTLFMVPTFDGGVSDGQVDFDPREAYNNQVNKTYDGKDSFNLAFYVRKMKQSDIMNKKLLILGGDDKKVKSPMAKSLKTTATAVQQDPNELIQNTGEICPYNCPNPSTLSVIDQ